MVDGFLEVAKIGNVVLSDVPVEVDKFLKSERHHRGQTRVQSLSQPLTLDYSTPVAGLTG